MKTSKNSTSSLKQLSFDDMFDDFFDEEIEVTIIDEEIVEGPKHEELSFVLMDIDNIRATVPQLLPKQQDDVLKAELRYFNQKGKGILFTNATGDGKTFTGLGVIKRFLLQGKNNVLIVVPTDKKCKDWIDDAEILDFKVNQLKGISDCYPGVNVTTYANFYQNDKIKDQHWHLVVYDESHYLQQNGQGDTTVYQNTHKIIAKLPSSIKAILNSDENRETTYKMAENDVKKIISDYVQSTKVLMLSATPFAYVKSVMYADGCLWDINETEDLFPAYPSGIYNEPNVEEKFFIENFGYRMIYNKLTIPKTGVDLNLMEREFHEKFKKLGVISGRQLDIDKDYSRDFVIVDSSLGDKIDKGREIFDTDHFKNNYKVLNEWYEKKYKGLYNRQLLETIKVRLVLPRILKHIKNGRKVVLFHDFNRAIPSHPFRFTVEELMGEKYEEILGWRNLQQDIDNFNEEYSYLYDLDLSELTNSITEYSKVFGKNVALFNGTISKLKRSKVFMEFMTDYSEVDFFCVQRKAGKEGISAHDMTGSQERVLIDLGLPTSPTDAIQCEGRIYRYGVQSNARFEYPVIMTNFERQTFAQTIAERSRTAENLALGNLARNMEIVFKEGYAGADYLDPLETTGTGGKNQDRFILDISEFERAKTYYWSQQKKTSKNKAAEGKDYFATPEPLGFKIVEWLDLKSDERVLEPSCGHGAISRFFPAFTNNVMIEPSYELSTKAMINSIGDVYNFDFEKYSIVNSFSKIAMNPPFGHGGILAAEHIEKCLRYHLKRFNSNSKLIAIVPDSPIYDKKMEEVLENKQISKFFEMTREIILPLCTFERAGTNVRCKIQFFELKKINAWSEENSFERIDLSDAKDIREFFDKIEHLNF